MNSRYPSIFLLTIAAVFAAERPVATAGEPARRAPAARAAQASIDAALQSALSRPAPASEPSAAAIAALAFQPDPTVSEREKERAIKAAGLSEKKTPATYTAIRSGELLGQFNRLLRRHRYDPDNLGDVLAAYLVLMWEIVADRDSSTIPAGQSAVRRQLVPKLAKVPTLATLSDEHKQQRAEATAYRTMLAVIAFQQFKRSGDLAKKQALQATVRDSLLRSGVDLRTVDLTAQGLVAR